ncbi:hypothetical protein BGZ95_002432 [Linnemannia exigua]|uniref:Uncharacterized protein n=1 Tax=Linnemannia exigua TaxID=604196 RepID=A0AAD4D5Y4_9FUNG|nr:hypothetical protein BGZ95_002432 [Linnemannia exigua]
MEVLSTPGMTDSQDVFQRERRFESRIPVPKARRATAESVSRPNPRHNKAAGAISYAQLASAPSTPRPIPKNNNNKRTPIPQSKSAASSYTFDDTVANPFASSTPSAFTPSMEPTSFLASRPSQDTTSASNDSFFNSTSTATPTKTKPDTPASPIPTVTKPFMGAAARTRDASVSSLPGPRHEDMIIPVVAKRIKEQGLYDHDVIAYSDDYNAPLYKAPSTPANVGNPFASYDRMKAASSVSLSNPKSPPASSSSAYDQAMDRNKARQESMEDYNQASTSEHPASPVSPPLSNTSPDLSAGQPTRRHRERKETVESQQQQSFNDPSSSGSSSPVATRPDRPRRARRNTERSTRHDQYATYVDYDAQNAPNSPEVPHSPISRQEYLDRTQQPSWDRPYLTNSAGQDPYAPPANTPTRQEIAQNLGANVYQHQETREQGYESYYQQDTYNNYQQKQQQQQQQQYRSQQQQYQQRPQQQSYIDSSSNNNYYQDQAVSQNNGHQDQQQQGRTQSGRSRPEMVQVEMSTMDNGPREGKASEEQHPPQVVQVDARDTIKKEKKGSVCCIVM